MEIRKSNGQFGKGNVSWSKTHKYSEASKKKMSEARMGKSPWNKGKPMSDETKEKLRQFNLGKKMSEDTKEKISQAMQGKNIAFDNPMWKGGKRKIESGYIFIYAPYHPFQNDGYVMEHRLIMEKHLGRFLKPEEVIHHINGKRDDNRFENLKLFANNAEHGKHHYYPGKFTPKSNT